MCEIFRFWNDGDTYYYSENLFLKCKPQNLDHHQVNVYKNSEKIVMYRPYLTNMKTNLYTLVHILLIKNNFYESLLGDINDLNDEVSQSSKKMTSTLTPSSSLGADPQSPISSVDNVFPSSQSTGAIGEDPVSGDSKYICTKTSP